MVEMYIILKHSQVHLVNSCSFLKSRNLALRGKTHLHSESHHHLKGAGRDVPPSTQSAEATSMYFGKCSKIKLRAAAIVFKVVQQLCSALKYLSFDVAQLAEANLFYVATIYSVGIGPHLCQCHSSRVRSD